MVTGGVCVGRPLSLGVGTESLSGELRQAVDRFRPQRRGVPRDCGLACLFDARHPPIEGRDQFLERTREVIGAHRHVWTRLAPASRREAFQISPQPPHRQ